MLTALRTAVAADLAAAEIKAVEYIGETITPPCAVVVPGQPYLVWPTRANGIPFGRVQVNVDVLLLVAPEAAQTAASRIDRLIEDALGALDEHDVVSAARPGVVTLRGAKFVGASLTIQQITEEP